MRLKNGIALTVGFAAVLTLSIPALGDPRPQQTSQAQAGYRAQPFDPLLAQLFAVEQLEPRPLPLPRSPPRRVTAR